MSPVPIFFNWVKRLGKHWFWTYVLYFFTKGGGGWDFYWLLQAWPLATFIGNNRKIELKCSVPTHQLHIDLQIAANLACIAGGKSRGCRAAQDFHERRLEISVTADFFIPKTNNRLNKLYWCTFTMLNKVKQFWP